MTPAHFTSFDGTRLAYRVLGSGPPVVLLHGLFSGGEMNWLRYGEAQTIAGAGFTVHLLDFRAHGDSDAPIDPATYPADVLALDVEAFIAHLALSEFDLGGYSLGARTVVRLLARGLKPRRAVISGMGLSGITGSAARRDWFLRVIAERDSFAVGTEGWFAAQFMRTGVKDPDAVAHILRAQLETTRDTIATLATPALVVCGADDQDNGSAPDLAAALPNASYVEVPGNHMSAVTRPELGRAIADFLAA